MFFFYLLGWFWVVLQRDNAAIIRCHCQRYQRACKICQLRRELLWGCRTRAGKNHTRKQQTHLQPRKVSQRRKCYCQWACWYVMPILLSLLFNSYSMCAPNPFHFFQLPFPLHQWESYHLPVHYWWCKLLYGNILSIMLEFCFVCDVKKHIWLSSHKLVPWIYLLSGLWTLQGICVSRRHSKKVSLIWILSQIFSFLRVGKNIDDCDFLLF